MNYIVTDDELTAIANKIREKTGSSEAIQFTSEFISEIEKLTDTRDANATASDILNGKIAYVNKQKITGTIQSKGATVYYPKTFDQTVEANQYLVGVQTFKGITTTTATYYLALSSVNDVTIYPATTMSFTFSLTDNVQSINPTKRPVGIVSLTDFPFMTIDDVKLVGCEYQYNTARIELTFKSLQLSYSHSDNGKKITYSGGESPFYSFGTVQCVYVE